MALVRERTVLAIGRHPGEAGWSSEFRPYLIGILTALYVLLGRWNFQRIQFGQETVDQPIAQVRHYVLLCMLLVTILGTSAQRSTRVRLLRPRFLVPMCAIFFLYEASAALWTPADAPTSVKVLDVCSLAATTLCVAFWTSGKRSGPFSKAFWVTFCAIAAVWIALTAAGYGLTDTQRTSALGGGPNVFGRDMALAFFGSLWLVRRKFGKYWIILTVLTPLFVLMSGSRGALFAFLCGAILYVVTEKTSRWKRAALVVSIVCISVAMMFYSTTGERALNTFRYRVLHLTIDQRYDGNRASILQTAYDVGMEYPLFGAGLASFNLYSIDFYAHNIFMEVFSETGGVGVCLLLLPLGVFAVFCFRHRKQVERTVLCAFVVSLVHAQFSGDLFDSRNVFTFLMMSSSLLVVKRRFIMAPRQPDVGGRAGTSCLRTAV